MAPVCRERRNIANTLLDTSAVMTTLEMLVGCILHVGACFCYMAIFGVDVGHLLLSLSSMAIAFAFIFGNSLRTVYESVVFLFLVHPYQVGDRINYDGRNHTVKNFGLMSTQFYRCDGTKVWVRLCLSHAAGQTRLNDRWQAGNAFKSKQLQHSPLKTTRFCSRC
jgi:small-conductance mechanosensitive channel